MGSDSNINPCCLLFDHHVVEGEHHGQGDQNDAAQPHVLCCGRCRRRGLELALGVEAAAAARNAGRLTADGGAGRHHWLALARRSVLGRVGDKIMVSM